MHRLARWVPLLIVAVVAVGVAVAYFAQDDATPEPVDVRSDATGFENVEDLAAAADLIVEGAVVAVEDGRVISGSTDSNTGIRTQLAQVEVQLIAETTGEVPPIVVVEQEAGLLDGTPITVDGVAPLEIGQHVILLLVSGDSEEFPYTTPLSSQAVFYIADDAGELVSAADPTGVIGALYHDLPADDLRFALGLREPG